MGLILAPLAPEKVATWNAFISEATGPRKAEMEEFNRRHGLTKHEAWLAETPAGSFVVAIHEGPGAAELMPKLAQSSHPFDQWFASKLKEVHGMDVSKPPPGKMPERKMHWSA